PRLVSMANLPAVSGLQATGLPRGKYYVRADRPDKVSRGRPWPALLTSAPLERRHHVLGEPGELILEVLRAHALGPVDHEVLEARILRLDRLDAVDHVLRGAAEPCLLRDALGERRDFGWRAGRAPGAALFVGVAHEAERREPFVALVVRGLDRAHRFGLTCAEADARTPDHVLAELLVAAMLLARLVVGADHVVEDLLAVERDHRLEAVLRHHVDGLAARDRHPDFHG